MTAGAAATHAGRTASGATLRSSAERRFSSKRAWIGGLLVSPAILMTVLGLILPLGIFLMRSVSNDEIRVALPQTLKVLRAWNGEGLPPDAAYAALGSDLARASEDGSLGDLARRLNFLVPGYRTLVMKTASGLVPDGPAPRGQLTKLDARWGQPDVWRLLRRESGSWTASYYLTALDLQRSPDGGVERVDPSQRLFVGLFVRTFVISVTVTLLCLLLGYPAAYVLSSASPFWVPVFLVMLLLPFWTSTLVRSTAWIVLLQGEGLVNHLLRWIGVISSPLPLFANRFAVLVAMTHVLLPYMIMPLYGAMKAVPPELMRAAGSLGATPWRAFRRVYLPQTYAGIAAGTLLVFILALGYYVTPALVGGPADQMVSYFIALYTNQSLNWGLASALGCLLLALTAAFYAAFSRFGGFKIELG